MGVNSLLHGNGGIYLTYTGNTIGKKVALPFQVYFFILQGVNNKYFLHD